MSTLIRFLAMMKVRGSFIVIFIITLPISISLLLQPMNYFTLNVAGLVALVFFLIAFFLFPFLYTIKHLPANAFRKRFVLFTRIYNRFHIALALFGILWIVFHIIGMSFYVPSYNLHLITGIVSVVGLLLVSYSGYLRKIKASGRRRKNHRFTALLFLLFVFIHVFWV